MPIDGKPVITPTAWARGNKWSGTPAEGTDLTREQVTALSAGHGRFLANRLRYKLPERYSVPVTLTGDDGFPVYTAFPCPVVSCSRDRKKICFITPNGEHHWFKWSKA